MKVFLTLLFLLLLNQAALVDFVTSTDPEEEYPQKGTTYRSHISDVEDKKKKKAGSKDQTGHSLSQWQEGSLEIHHINTGEGDATFLILPDGTTLLIDAGDASKYLPRPKYYKAPRRPDNSRSSGEWIGRYILARHPVSSEPQIDYVLMTHFHADHISGINDVAQLIPIQILFDRDWPQYKSAPDDAVMKEYYRFLSEHTGKGMTVKRLEAGRNDQLTLKNHPEKFPEFSIQNLAVNGIAWTGEAQNARPRYPEGTEITENMASAALLLRYGPFSYFTGGDIRRDLEKTIAWIVGPVDVHVANHHGSQADPFFLSILQPRVHIIQVWATPQPRPEVFERLLSRRIYPGPRDVFLSNGMWIGRKKHLTDRYGENIARQYAEELMEELAADQGHIVIRVKPGGSQYKIFVLDDSNETYTITSVHGPYNSL